MNMKKMISRFCNSRFASQQGSALLIVLGFLSFMMISAVSFSIYMRIEHQASANYRHVTIARQSMQAALNQAMDEVDSQLRIRPKQGIGSSGKFPDASSQSGWLGRRVLTSADPYLGDVFDISVPRVLSLDSLGYIPALLVNDVRRYAVANPDDTDYVSRGEEESLDGSVRVLPGFAGAKWRPIICPVTTLDNESQAANSSNFIARFAYACVNVSDMLDINYCSSALNDSSANEKDPNQYFLNHRIRLSPDAFDNQFNERLKKDKHYDSLMDFYTCMDDFDPEKSPFHQYLYDGREKAFNEAVNEITDKVGPKHIFVTDSFVKPEPGVDEEHFINLNELGNLTKLRDDDPKVIKNLTSLFEHSTHLTEAFTQLFPNQKRTHEMLAGMIQDYLDYDDVPHLNIPSLERVPMISRLSLGKGLRDWKAEIECKKVVISEEDNSYDLNYFIKFEKVDREKILNVETLYPFLDDKIEQKSAVRLGFDVKAKVDLIAGDSQPQFDLDKNKPSKVFPFNLKKRGERAEQSLVRADDKNLTSYWKILFENNIEPDEIQVAKCEVRKGSRGALQYVTPFKKEFKLTLRVFTWVTDKDGKVVDAAPFVSNGATMDSKSKNSLERAITQGNNTLYFRSVDEKRFNELLEKMGEGEKKEYVVMEDDWQWKELRIADPRFNYRARDWYTSNETITKPRTLNQINTELSSLLGKNGRDGDIFMEVPNKGNGRFISPGELGFLVRPFIMNRPEQDENTIRIGFVEAPNQVPDQENMFRTIRLYDQGGYARDQVYRYFGSSDPNRAIHGIRVNPMSNIDSVLKTALEGVPMSWATNQLEKTEMYKNLMYANPKSEGVANSSSSLKDENNWRNFANEWVSRMKKAQPLMSDPYKTTLYDVYGKADVMNWYSSPGDVENPFGENCYLREVERKMLYSWTLDNLSSRQQLFLYFISVETLAPSTALNAKVKSTASTRAVALVWRDPYPFGFRYEKDSGTYQWDTSNDWYQNTQNKMSPWDLYKDSDSFDSREKGFHEQRVLFFRQLN